VRRLILDCHLDVPVDAVWPQLLAADAHAVALPGVQVARVLSAADGERVTEWSVLLRGCPMRWSQVERIDPAARSVEFRRLHGDPREVNGAWSLRPDGTGTAAAVTIDVDFGLPRVTAVFDLLLVGALGDVIRGVTASAVRAARTRTLPLSVAGVATDRARGTDDDTRPEEGR
jgi:hypothetical protein